MSTIPGAPANPSPQLQVILTCFATMGTMTFEDIRKYTTSDFQRYTWPKSLGRPGPLDVDGFIANIKNFFSPLKEYNFAIDDVYEGPNYAVIHGGADLLTKEGNKYKTEYIFIFETEQQSDGSYKIKVLKEFVDSKSTMEFYAKELLPKKQ
ncbi:hypothetical protein C8Q75DRAFT_805116 [Abortiporus biennis]|nr:hypothetical protein C8Q75DRAFT_805116 [Abortiporus biennis]